MRPPANSRTRRTMWSTNPEDGRPATAHRGFKALEPKIPPCSASVTPSVREQDIAGGMHLALLVMLLGMIPTTVPVVSRKRGAFRPARR